MRHPGHNWSWGFAFGLGLLLVGATAEASTGTPSGRPVLVTPVVGSEAVADMKHGEIHTAVRRALEAEGFRVVDGQELFGRAIIACQTPECTEQALNAAGAELAIVPALWERNGGESELTLTLVQREGHNVNVEGVVADDLELLAQALVVELLAAKGTAPATTDAGSPKRMRPNAWMSGPVLLVTGGSAAFITIGAGAATKSDTQQLDTASVAAWSTVGAAALAGGIAWWVVAAKRRRHPPESLRGTPVFTLGATRVDLRLRF